MKSIAVNEAIENISEYLGSDNIYPYFVSVSGSNEYRLLLHRFASLKKVKVSEFCSADAYPDLDGFLDAVKEEHNEKLILGVGEYITCGGNIDILYSLKNLPSPKTVVLCRGIKQELSKLNNADRKFNARRFCCVDSELDFSVISAEFPIGLQLCEGYKNLISVLEDGANGNVYVKTSLNVDPTRKISSAYNALREQDLHFELPENCLDDEHWSEFLENPDISGSYELTSWREYLKLKLNPSEANDYLRAVVATSVNYSAYKKNLFDLILSYSPKSKEYGVFYPQRKELLKAAQDMGINSYLAKSKQRESQRIYYLTDNTEEEQYEIIKEIVSLGAVPKEIVTIFPELNDYLCKYAFGCKNGELLTEYFQEYKTNKLLNRIPNTFLETVKEYSLDGNRKYNVLPTRGSLVEQYNNGKNGMIWIDALGVEFLGYIQRICAKIGLKMDVQIGRAVLPTLTSKNKSFYDEWKGPKQQTKRLDDIKHKGEDRFNYESDGDGKLPLHIVAELKVIKDALYRAKSLLLQEEVRKVIIASDHGASRLAVINEHQSKHTMSDTTGQHSGRCCPLSETDERPDSATSENGFWVLANYDRFGGGRKASVEVHGGATLEEVIVPVIELTLLDSSITMENLTPTVWSSYNENPVLELFCAANVNKMRLRVGDVTYEAEKVSNVKYRFVLDKHKISGPYTAEVLDSDSIIGKISFDIQKRSGEKNSKVEDEFFI